MVSIKKLRRRLQLSAVMEMSSKFAVIHGPYKQQGRQLRSGNPFRSIKESMISRAPGVRAAQAYLSNPKPPAITNVERRVSTRPTGGNRRSTDLAVDRHIGGMRKPKSIERSGPRSFSKVERSILLERSTNDIEGLRSKGVDARPTFKHAKDITRRTTPNPIGRANAGKYLRNKAITHGLGQLTKKGAVSTVGNVAKGLLKGSAGGLATTALELGTGVLAISRAKREEREAKIGTAMIRSAMKERRKPKIVKMD
jgi:hypothetical protein